MKLTHSIACECCVLTLNLLRVCGKNFYSKLWTACPFDRCNLSRGAVKSLNAFCCSYDGMSVLYNMFLDFSNGVEEVSLGFWWHGCWGGYWMRFCVDSSFRGLYRLTLTSCWFDNASGNRSIDFEITDDDFESHSGVKVMPRGGGRLPLVIAFDSNATIQLNETFFDLCIFILFNESDSLKGGRIEAKLWHIGHKVSFC